MRSTNLLTYLLTYLLSNEAGNKQLASIHLCNSVRRVAVILISIHVVKISETYFQYVKRVRRRSVPSLAPPPLAQNRRRRKAARWTYVSTFHVGTVQGKRSRWSPQYTTQQSIPVSAAVRVSTNPLTSASSSFWIQAFPPKVSTRTCFLATNI